MTGYTVHSGSNDKFADGWDRIFGGDTPAEDADKSTKSRKSGKKSAGKTTKAKRAKSGGRKKPTKSN